MTFSLYKKFNSVIKYTIITDLIQPLFTTHIPIFKIIWNFLFKNTNNNDNIKTLLWKRLYNFVSH